MTQVLPAWSRPSRTALTVALAVVLPLAVVGRASELRRTALVRAIEAAAPSIVNLQGQKTVSAGADAFGDGQRRVNGMGTGVLIDPRGYVLTNYHVVEGVRPIQATLADGRKTTARLMAHDPATDLAVIKIPTQENLPLITIGSSHDLMPGEPVAAVGNAYGYEHTVTRGVISALHRTVQVSEAQQYEDLIQTDASINPGNSGGPLLNIDGEMIGINVAVRVGAQGIGFAIPVDKAMDVAAKLMSIERVQGTWHGVVPAAPVDSANKRLVVRGVHEGSPAAAGGLLPGDVITSVGGIPIQRTLDLERSMLGTRVGEEVAVEVLRSGEPLQVSVVMATAPRNRARTDTRDQRIWQALGLRLDTIAPASFRGLETDYRGGLRVVSVRTGCAAERLGVRRGDILVGLHKWETITPDNVSYVLNQVETNDQIDPLKFYILRGEETLYGHLRVAARSR